MFAAMNASKLFGWIVVAFGAIALMACDRAAPPTRSVVMNKPPLVNNVYNYNDELLAHYEYNSSGQLIKRTYTHPMTKASTELIFHYDIDRVQTVEYVDLDSMQFTHEKRFFYTPEGQVERIETHQGGEIIRSFHLNYSSDGLVESVNATGTEPSTFFEYDGRGDVVKTETYYTNIRTGKEVSKVEEFTYDDKHKVNFGLDYLVGIELLPKLGTKSNWEQSLSKHNLVSEGFGGTKYVEYLIEYNDAGYPISITTQWKDMETNTPAMLKIEYR